MYRPESRTCEKAAISGAPSRRRLLRWTGDHPGSKLET